METVQALYIYILWNVKEFYVKEKYTTEQHASLVSKCFWGNYGIQWKMESQERNSRKVRYGKKIKKNGKYTDFPFSRLLYNFLMLFLDPHALYYNGFCL